MKRTPLSFFALCLALPAAALAATDVKSSGLKGDGTADDTPALQKLLDGGQTDLYFPPGKYRLGAVNVPAQSRLSFAPGARVEANPEGLTFQEEAEKGGKKRMVTRTKPLFSVKGDHVRIEGLQFDFSSGATAKNPTPVEQLVSAEGVSDVVVSGASVERSGDKVLKDTVILLTATGCRNVVLENSGATNLSHMLMAKECSNVTARGNWMIGGASLTTFSGGSESLRHYDNWSRQVGYQCVWRGGSPDPSRKAPQVPLGTANVVKRGVKPGSPDYVNHTEGVFDVSVKNNYAEYGTTLCWGNKGRQTIVEGNTARFMFDYAYGTEGGENLVFANNVSINSAVAGICSLYWGEKLSVTGNIVIVRHEPFNPEFAKRAESVYYGQFIRLHHGPSNPEDLYGAGGVQITGNLFINELGNRPSGISIEGGRDVLVNGNKIINGLVRKHDEVSTVKVDAKATETDEFAAQNQGTPADSPVPAPGTKVDRRVGSNLSRVTIMGNEFISRQAAEKACVLIDGTVSSAVVKDNIFRREASIVPVSDAELALEAGAPRYMLYAQDNAADKRDLTNANPTNAIGIAPFTGVFAVVQGNLIVGWKDSIRAENTSAQGKAAFVVTGNTTDGTVVVEGPADRTTKKVDGNIELPAGSVPPDVAVPLKTPAVPPAK